MQDTEMQAAIDELKAARIMCANAQNTYRDDEAWFRVQAAISRIDAIRFERSVDP